MMRSMPTPNQVPPTRIGPPVQSETRR
jgi:hypothetical protein